MKKKVSRKWIWIVVLVIILIVFYFWLTTKTSISSKNYCKLDSDCIVYQPACIYGCWNKNNLPEPVTLPPNAGMCASPTEISGCVCEKNRCQPLPSERNENNFYLQPCISDNNCFPDEVCLDFNTLSWHYEYPVKRFDISEKICYQKCTSNTDCPINMRCITAKLVSSATWKDLTIERNWSTNKELADAPTTKYCYF